MTTEEIEAIVLAEYAYWKDVPGTVGISAVGACANIYAAIAVGHRAPWHPPAKVDLGKLAESILGPRASEC